MGANLPLAFPDSYKSGVRHETITRGGIIEERHIAKEAISALQSTGKPPITLFYVQGTDISSYQAQLQSRLSLRKRGNKQSIRVFS